MPIENRRGRPPLDPLYRREKVVAVRFTTAEWSHMKREIDFAAARGVRVSPSDLIRKAVRSYKNWGGQANLGATYRTPRAPRTAR